MMPVYFTAATFGFLRQLKSHNDRRWFEANKERYQREVRDPMLRFISDVAEPFQRISPQVVADPRPVGGSMFRVHRDTRFSKDKTPYKTHAAAHFRHRAGRDVHGPGYYLHLEPGNVFFGAGIWHPDREALAAIRAAIVDNHALWMRITRARAFCRACRFDGESAKRPPAGVDPDHPLIDDIMRKEFTVLADSTQAAALRPNFLDRFVAFCRVTAGFNAFLARSLGLDW